MKESDGYYLKEGRLELSMLDDEEDEIKQLTQSNNKAQSSNVEYEHTRRRRERRRMPLVGQAQPKLKVSKEVYNTLHEMGQFLTQSEEDSSEDSSQMVTVDVESVVENFDADCKRPVSKDKLVDNAPDEMRQLLAKQLESMVYTTKTVEDDPLDFEQDQPVSNEVCNLEQKKIDDILETYFKAQPSKSSMCESMQELKTHIEKKIACIKNYQ